MPIPDIEGGGGAGKYFKMSALKGGPVKATIVTKVISFWEGWADGGKKPIRAPKRDQLPAGIVWREEKYRDPGPQQKFAWAWINHTEGDILQCVDIQQVSIIKQLKEIEAIEEWGELPEAGYSIVLTRATDDDGKVSYSVTAIPAVKVPAKKRAEINETLYKWTGPTALVGNGDPWALFGDDVVRDKGDGDIPF